jgi:hypothetical protein
MKLRKHIRTKLLHDVQQMGTDRVVIFTFGTNENAYHVILELYAGGNVILTDHTFCILSLLRMYELEEGAAAKPAATGAPAPTASAAAASASAAAAAAAGEKDSVKVAVGEIYPVHMAAEPAPPTQVCLVAYAECKGYVLQQKLSNSNVSPPSLLPFCFLLCMLAPHLLVSGLQESLTQLWQTAIGNPKSKVVSDIFPPGSAFSSAIVDHCLVEGANMKRCDFSMFIFLVHVHMNGWMF